MQHVAVEGTYPVDQQMQHGGIESAYPVDQQMQVL